MRVLGIDIGIAITGWSIVTYNHGKHQLEVAGAILTEKGLSDETRLQDLYTGLTEVIQETKPDVSAVEKLFFFKNKKTIITVGQARGVILLALANHNIPVYNYTPLEVKTAVSGYGKADKKQVQKMVQLLFKLDEIPTPDDIADAIAIAYCHCNSSNITYTQ